MNIHGACPVIRTLVDAIPRVIVSNNDASCSVSLHTISVLLAVSVKYSIPHKVIKLYLVPHVIQHSITDGESSKKLIIILRMLQGLELQYGRRFLTRQEYGDVEWSSTRNEWSKPQEDNAFALHICATSFPVPSMSPSKPGFLQCYNKFKKKVM
eukprot:PhF_6_TR41485/c0_g1_i2/m.62887